MKLVCAPIVASCPKPESFLTNFLRPRKKLNGLTCSICESSRLTRTLISANGHPIHAWLWHLFFITTTIDPCSGLTVGLPHILVSVEAESPVAVFQPLSNLVVGIILQLVTRLLRASKGAESQQPGSRSSKAHRKRTCGGKGSFFTMLHLHGRRAWH